MGFFPVQQDQLRALEELHEQAATSQERKDEREEVLRRKERELEEKQRNIDAAQRALNEAKHNVKPVVEIQFEDLAFEKLIGEGGFGNVWQGRWKSRGRELVSCSRLLNVLTVCNRRWRLNVCTLTF